MQQQQQQQLRQQELDQDAASRTDAVSSLLASSEASLLRFTLDSERAEFAVSALHDLNRGPESELGFVQHSEAAKPPSRANLSVKSLLLSAASGASVISGTGASATGSLMSLLLLLIPFWVVFHLLLLTFLKQLCFVELLCSKLCFKVLVSRLLLIKPAKFCFV